MVAPVIQRARSAARERDNICGGFDPCSGVLGLLFGMTTTPLRVFLAEARVSGLRPVTMTFAPWVLKSWAVARPMPVVPPVIRMVLEFMEYRSLVPYFT